MRVKGGVGDWVRARAMWEAGEFNPAIRDATGVVITTLKKRAVSEGWQRNTAELEDHAEARRQRTEAAKQAAARKWANRRNTEADAAGITAARARASIVSALDDRDDKMTRASAIAYGILIDKAQLLSGDATARVDGIDPRDRAAMVLDELAARRTGT